MNRHGIKTLKEFPMFTYKLFTNLNDVFPSGVLNPYPMDSYDVVAREFLSKYGSRALSNFADEIIGMANLDDYDTLNVVVLYAKNVIASRFKSKWKRLDDLWNTEYDPLSPFDITLNESKTDSLEVTEDISNSSSSNDVYAYNSDEPQPSDTSSSESSNSYIRENPSTRDYTRKGNIGNTSRQELVEQEREVLRYQIIDEIYSDIATVLCRGKYIL